MIETDQKVSEDILAIIKKFSKKDSISLNTKINDLAIDSLTFIEIIFEIEKRFDTMIPEKAASIGQDALTIGSLIQSTISSLRTKENENCQMPL